jgi:GNAT superfamily N-acetyltransferase
MPVVLNEILLGRRVVVRYRRRNGDATPPFSDVVGDLIALDGLSATITTRHGPVVIAVADVVLARAVAPDRRQILALERIASHGWQAAEQRDLDGWLLRAEPLAAHLPVANSVLPLGTPTRPLTELLTSATRFYRERGLPAQIQIPLPARGLLDAELATRCWTVARPGLMLSRPIVGWPMRPDAGGLSTMVESVPSSTWQRGYRARDGQLSQPAVNLLARHDQVGFASVTSDDETVGIARGVVEDGWLGVTAVEVAADQRRRGIASALMQSLVAWAHGQATYCYLQVETNNAAGLGFCHQLGFAEHHHYHYRRAPEAV